MDQKWIPILVILVFYQEITSGAGEDIRKVKEGESVDILCQPGSGSMVVWFRVLDKSGMDFIGSFSSTGIHKTPGTKFDESFTHTKIKRNILTLKSFKKNKDSGVYSCASLYKGTELQFGPLTRLLGEKKEETTSPPQTVTKQVATTACVCKDKNKQGATSPSLFCTPIILGPLAGSCGLLLLLLIVTTLYCNRIRTRRCPHHHKRKLRMVAPEKQMMTNRHV